MKGKDEKGWRKDPKAKHSGKQQDGQKGKGGQIPLEWVENFLPKAWFLDWPLTS